MNKEKLDKWIELLESGNYMQGHWWLKKDDQYCCLGVYVEGVCGLEADGKYLPLCLLDQSIGLQKLGFSIPVSWVRDVGYDFGDSNPSDTLTLTQLNDIYELSFTQIASLLRRKREELYGPIN